jgi:hypothetical protein
VREKFEDEERTRSNWARLWWILPLMVTVTVALEPRWLSGLLMVAVGFMILLFLDDSPVLLSPSEKKPTGYWRSYVSVILCAGIAYIAFREHSPQDTGFFVQEAAWIFGLAYYSFMDNWGDHIRYNYHMALSQTSPHLT